MKYGWFSATAAKAFGTMIYQTPSSGEVTVTNVTHDKEGAMCKWPDRQYVGIVTDEVRPEQPQESPPGLADEDIDMELIRRAFNEILMTLDSSALIFVEHDSKIENALQAIMLHNEALKIMGEQQARFLKMISIFEERLKKLEAKKPIRGKPSDN
jgi:hypothetical protein